MHRAGRVDGLRLGHEVDGVMGMRGMRGVMRVLLGHRLLELREEPGRPLCVREQRGVHGVPCSQCRCEHLVFNY